MSEQINSEHNNVNLAIAIARLEENTKNISNQMESMLKLIGDHAAINESLKTAHKRLDETQQAYTTADANIIAIINQKDVAQDERISKLERAQFWLATSFVGAVLVIIINKVLT